MAITAKGVDRLSFGGIYVLVILLTFWAGFRLLNHGFELRFFKAYVLQWETRLNAFNAKQGIWPVFNGSNHRQYMESLSARMTQFGISLPRSNTQEVYRYRIEHFGGRSEEIFILSLHDRMVLFGLSGKTLGRLDQLIDGLSDLTRGRVSGRLGKSGETYIGQVRL